MKYRNSICVFCPLGLGQGDRHLDTEVYNMCKFTLQMHFTALVELISKGPGAFDVSLVTSGQVLSDQPHRHIDILMSF